MKIVDSCWITCKQLYSSISSCCLLLNIQVDDVDEDDDDGDDDYDDDDDDAGNTLDDSKFVVLFSSSGGWNKWRKGKRANIKGMQVQKGSQKLIHAAFIDDNKASVLMMMVMAMWWWQEIGCYIRVFRFDFAVGLISFSLCFGFRMISVC